MCLSDSTPITGGRDIGFWFLLAWLDAGTPMTASMYTGADYQRCLQVASEHLEAQSMRPGAYVEMLYLGCVQGSAPRVIR